ncbi:hypothetical protein LIP88_19695, partial [Erysipelatoclostridium ramosum]|nr:hypothetical protein [Thomasclavelia ramosa]
LVGDAHTTHNDEKQIENVEYCHQLHWLLGFFGLVPVVVAAAEGFAPSESVRSDSTGVEDSAVSVLRTISTSF